MESYFNLSFRGNIVQLDKHILQSLPKNSKFADIVQKQHNLGLGEILQENRHDLQIYVNRSISLFNHILDYIEHGELHYPHHVCPIIISKELEFWGYSEKDLGSCCLDRVLKDRDDNKKLRVITEEWEKCSKITQVTVCSNYRKLWKKKGSEESKRKQSEDSSEEQQPIETLVTLSEIDVKGITTEEQFQTHDGYRTSGCFLEKLSELLANPLDSVIGKVSL